VFKLDWAEPGDPPNADFESVRARPLARPIAYDSLTPEIERELVRRWHEDGDERALKWLVGAHRPMVVRMAQRWARGNRRKLERLIEYGMFGLRLAAAPPRPSKTKKGQMVGFDPRKGYRFSTYARSEADKQMRLAALAEKTTTEFDNQHRQDLQDTLTEFREWAKTPIPAHIEEACKNNPPDAPKPLEPSLAVRTFAWDDEPRGKFRLKNCLWDQPSFDPCFCASITNFGGLVYWLECRKPKPHELRRKTRPTQGGTGEQG
jgi:hypothetical protein